MPYADSLTPPGSTVYNSDTMHVGDGTWDNTKDTFLLPNLQGLNFETMRANGMGNRFLNQPQYHAYIKVHGILAAIVFLLLVPFAILFVRFSRRPRWAVRLHIWCQILTLFLTTALFILPFFAVGPTRSLTNPHHGIGVAIFVLVIIQFLWGTLVYTREKRRRLPVVPFKTVLHRWFGRLIALLGLAQIPLGLTLYGSPLFLFVLYALVVLGLLVIYFSLSFIDERNEGRDMDSNTSWASGTGSTVSRRRHSRFGTVAKTAAAGAGIGYIANKLRNRHEAVPSRRNSGSYVEEEKYSEHNEVPGNQGGWKGKVLGAGILGGLAGRFLGRKHRDDGSIGSGYYTESDASRREEEGMSPNAAHPLNRPLGHHRSHSSISYTDDYMSASPSRQPRKTGLRNAVVGLGAFGVARNLFKNRRERKEQRRIEELRQQDIEEERINRANSKRQKFTGDGYSRPGRASSMTSTNLTPAPVGGAVASGAVPLGTTGIPGNQSAISASGPPYMSGPTIDGQPLPVVPPPPQAVHHSTHDFAQSDVFSSPGRGNNMAEAAAAGVAGGAAGLAAGDARRTRQDRSSSRRRRSGSTGNMASPPVSVKLNMHSDGRHVTLRRLTEEEAAQDRARRVGRSGSRRRPAGSSSTLGAGEAAYGPDRWRRAEDRERQEQLAMERQELQNSQARLQSGNLAVPIPPIPSSEVHGPGSVGSPGTYDGTITEASTNYERNRKRRRAERAASQQAKAARAGGRGADSFE